MTINPITREEVTIRVLAEPEIIPVEGSACVSGDDDFDRKVEHNILSRLQQGDAWAWATAIVTVSWSTFEARSCLGCCSYAKEEDFRQPGGYFDDMVAEALDELNQQVTEVYEHLKLREQDMASRQS